MDSSSSDSDAGDGLRNVTSVFVQSEANRQIEDENQAYKRKLGDLVFNAHFEGGNLGFIERIDEYCYDLMVRPDVTNTRQRLWFNFTVANQRPNQCVIFNIVNFSEKIILFHEGLTPVVRTRKYPNWIRLAEDQVFYFRSDEHNGRYVLSLAFRFATYNDEHQFALLYPYNLTRLVDFISRWSVELKRSRIKQIQLRPPSRNSPELTRSESPLRKSGKPRTQSSLGFATSSQHMHLEKLSISTGSSGSHKPTRVIIMRSASGNLHGPASYVCQGLLDFMLSDDLIARVARQFIDFEVFPMIDPDSVRVGNYKSDILGQTEVSLDCFEANKKFYSNLQQVQADILKLCSCQSERVEIISISVNFNLIGSRIKGVLYEDDLKMESYLRFLRLMSRFADDFYIENCEFTYPIECLKPLDFYHLPNVHQYNLEVSPFAYYKRSLVKYEYKRYDQKKYLALGKAMVYALLELLKPKDFQIHPFVEATLESFQPNSEDIDDLTLTCGILSQFHITGPSKRRCT